MSDQGNDAGNCSHGLTAKYLREATHSERATYRKWMRGAIIVYSALLLFFGIAITSYSGIGPIQVTSLPDHSTR